MKKYLKILFLIKGLYPKYIKNIYNSIINTNNLNKKLETYLNKHFTKEDLEMSKKHIDAPHHWTPGKYRFKSQDTLIYQLTWLLKKKKKSNSKDVEKMEPHTLLEGI